MRITSREVVGLAVALCFSMGALAGEAAPAGEGGEGEVGHVLTILLADGAKATVSRTPDMERYPPGTEVKIEVRPWTDWSFSHWAEPGPNTPYTNTTVLMDEDKTLTAHFHWHCAVPPEDCYCYEPCQPCCGCPCPGEGYVRLDVYQQGMGCARADYEAAHEFGLYLEGQVVPIKATPHPGWAFSHWVGDVDDPTSPETTTLATGIRSITGVFVEIDCASSPCDCDQPDSCANPCCDCVCAGEGEAEDGAGYTLTVTLADYARATVTRNPDLDVYPPGTAVSLHVRAWSDFRFLRWQGDVCPPDFPSTTVVMDQDKSIVAHFEWLCRDFEGECDCWGNDCAGCCRCPCEGEGFWVLQIETQGAGTAEWDPNSEYWNGLFREGQLVPIHATPEVGWEFSHWVGDVADHLAQATTTVMHHSKMLTAVFVEIPPEGGPSDLHSADQDGNGRIGLSELLRVVQFYNSNGLHCAGSPGDTEDGFVPGEDAAQQSCAPHASDYDPQDWQVTLSELLRLIQFYNSPGLVPCTDSSDGFCPVP